MEMTPEAQLKEIACAFQRSGKNYSSALVYGIVAHYIPEHPAVYTGMGAALAKLADQGARLEHLTWSTKALKRGLLLGQGTPFESPCVNWLEVIKEEMDVVQPDPMAAEDLEGLLTFLDQQPGELLEEVRQLDEEDTTAILIAFGDLPRPRFLPIILAAAKGEFGEPTQRDTIERIANYKEDYEAIKPVLAEVAVHVDSYALQPQLGQAMQAIDADWAAQFESQA